MYNLSIILTFLESWPYLGIIIFLSLGGLVIPIPEEVLLLLVGYGAASGVTNIWLASGISFAAVLGSDLAVFWLSKHGSHLIQKIQKRIDPKKLERYQTVMRLHRGVAIFIFRLIIGLRFLSMVVAGSLNTKWWTFLIADTLALSLYVPLLIFLGYHFHSSLTAIITEVEVVRHLLSLAAILLVGLAVTYFLKRFLTHAPEPGQSN